MRLLPSPSVGDLLTEDIRPRIATYRRITTPSTIRGPKSGTATSVPMPANDEVERRAVAPRSSEVDLSQSSIPSLAHRRRAPRSLEPIVRRLRYVSIECPGQQ